VFGEWYWIGVAAGFGAALGLFCAGFATRRPLQLVAVVAAGGLGFLAGFLLDNWDEGVAGTAAGVIGAVGAAPLMSGALRGGGTRAGTAALLATAAIGVAAVGLVPGVGYAEAPVLLLLGARLKSVAGRRFAGLRILGE
jgi:hypothetical protein